MYIDFLYAASENEQFEVTRKNNLAGGNSNMFLFSPLIIWVR